VSNLPPEKQVERLSRLLLTSRDFQLALSSVTFLLEDLDWEQPHALAQLRRFYCYEAAFVTSYARPFVQARGGARPFTWKDIALTLSPQEWDLHGKIILDRNKLVAHSDADYVDLRRVILRTHVGERGPFDFALARYPEGVRLTYEECRTAELLLRRAMHEVLMAIQTFMGADLDSFHVIDIGER
jgi:hypothetical protein